MQGPYSIFTNCLNDIVSFIFFFFPLLQDPVWDRILHLIVRSLQSTLIWIFQPLCFFCDTGIFETYRPILVFFLRMSLSLSLCDISSLLYSGCAIFAAILYK